MVIDSFFILRKATEQILRQELYKKSKMFFGGAKKSTKNVMKI